MTDMSAIAPGSEDELAEAVRSATGPLWIKGGGTRGVVSPGTPVTTRGLSGITLYEPGALTLVAAAGTPMAEIETALAAEGQRLPFEPMDHRRLMGTAGDRTLGGVMAGNISGPRRIQSGAARDFALGVRFVDGTGQVIKNGGRVMKNVTGYDLVKLMCGAHGTLGVLTEVALKVLPIPETTQTLLLHGLTPKAAVQAMAAAMGTPYEVSGAAFCDGTVMLRLEGFEASVRYRLGRLQAALARFGADSTLCAGVDQWQAVRDVTAFAGVAGDVWRVSCRPSEGPELAERAGARAVIFDWAGGLLWLLCDAGDDLRARLGPYDGHATRLRFDGGAVPRFQPQAPAIDRLSAGLRQRFDPRGILNAGLMGGHG